MADNTKTVFSLLVTLTCLLMVPPLLRPQETSVALPYKLAFVGQVLQKGDPAPSSYLGSDGKVYVTSWRGMWRWAGGPSVALVDARNGKQLQKREIKVPCAGDYNFGQWQAVPHSNDIITEVGCGHVLVLDATTLEVKRELTADVPFGTKLWSSSFAVSRDGKTVALRILYDTKTPGGTPEVLRILRTRDWQVATDPSGQSWLESNNAGRDEVAASPNGEWRCAPNRVSEADQVTFSLSSTRTNKVLLTSEALPLLPKEKRDLDRSMSSFVGFFQSCQVSPDGQYVMQRVEFNGVARSRIYQVIFGPAVASETSSPAKH